MNNIKISENKGTYLDTGDNSIYLSDDKNSYYKLSIEDFLTYISDTITHEFIHYLLVREFNTTVSKLFDTVEKHFYTNIKAMESLYSVFDTTTTWHNFISTNGIKAFYGEYDITEDDLIEAKSITGGN